MSSCGCRICVAEPGDVPTVVHQFLLDRVGERSWFGYEADRRRIGWVYSIGFEHAFGQPEVVISGFGREHTSKMLDAVAARYARRGEVADGEVIASIRGDDISLRPVHDEWLAETDLIAGADWFNRGAPRAVQAVGSAPGNLAWPEQPRLWLPAADQAIRGWREFTTPDEADWPHPLPWDTPAIATKSIRSGSEWIYSVCHDEDGDWQFIDGYEHDVEGFERVRLSEIVELDFRVAELFDLPEGWHAYRDHPAAPWKRAQGAQREE